ncbi:hypothetical protein JYB87_14310 [Shewanella avicenniae]|uniref:Uncharacterized protein n=1 Tax=Shewanella avicenniae TaxID=2814294 RepID=A0ABX7QNG2_9GAMM|nr:hypothetical protein [Shewanella avicenniae]QSX32904.1 hypothetical protein JYB87_14310 [Shewanella avicenniae]
MKTTYMSLSPSTDLVKEASFSCKSCSRMIEIEGELLCYHGGKITSLKPLNPVDGCKNLLCDGWEKERSSEE